MLFYLLVFELMAPLNRGVLNGLVVVWTGVCLTRLLHLAVLQVSLVQLVDDLVFFCLVGILGGFFLVLFLV